jgi:hypothetical protein
VHLTSARADNGPAAVSWSAGDASTHSGPYSVLFFVRRPARDKLPAIFRRGLHLDSTHSECVFRGRRHRRHEESSKACRPAGTTPVEGSTWTGTQS